jgi:hypothetical protein
MDLSKLTVEELQTLLAQQPPADNPLAAMSDEDLNALVEKPEWGDLPSNIGSSAMKLGGDVGQMVVHPWDTAAAALEVGTGAISQFFPDVFENSTLQEAERKAGLVGQAMIDRYGSVENAKNSLITDPVGVMADIGGLMAGGGSLLAKAGGKAAQVAGGINKAASFVDPISLAGKGASLTGKGSGFVGKQAVGVMSGTAPENFSVAFEAGKAGGEKSKAFKRNIGDAQPYELVDTAKAGINQLKSEKNKQYRSGMVDISKDATVLDFSKIEDALANTVQSNTYKGKTKSKAVDNAIGEISAKIEDWKQLDPTEYHTPEGIDFLKQQVGDLVDWQGKHKTENMVIKDVYSGIKNTINKQAPIYDDIMRDYSRAASEIDEIERALSLNNKASVDTATRKLTSVMRNNVNTNFGNRAEMVKRIDEASGQPLMESIAGQALSSWTPRGLAGTGTQLLATGVAGNLLSPMALGTLPFQSPRLMGEAAHAAGVTSRYAKKAAPHLGMTPRAKQLMQSLPVRSASVQGGRLQGILQDELNKTRGN